MKLIPLKFKLIIIAILFTACALFIWDYIHTKSENKRLTSEISAANGTIEQLDQKNEAEKKITTTTRTIIREIRDAPKAHDAPVAIVLDNAIDRL